MNNEYDRKEHKASLHDLNKINLSLAETAIAKSASVAFLNHIPKWMEFVNWALIASGGIIAAVVVNIESIANVTGAKGLYLSTLSLGLSVVLGVLAKYQLMQLSSSVDSMKSVEKEVSDIILQHMKNSVVVEDGAQLVGEEIQTQIDVNEAMRKYLMMFPWPHRLLSGLIISRTQQDALMGYRFHLKWMCYILPLVGLQLLGLVAFIVTIGWSLWEMAQASI